MQSVANKQNRNWCQTIDWNYYTSDLPYPIENFIILFILSNKGWPGDHGAGDQPGGQQEERPARLRVQRAQAPHAAGILLPGPSIFHYLWKWVEIAFLTLSLSLFFYLSLSLSLRVKRSKALFKHSPGLYLFSSKGFRPSIIQCNVCKNERFCTIPIIASLSASLHLSLSVSLSSASPHACNR